MSIIIVKNDTIGEQYLKLIQNDRRKISKPKFYGLAISLERPMAVEADES